MKDYEKDDLWGMAHVEHIVGAESPADVLEMVKDSYFMPPFWERGEAYWPAVDVMDWLAALKLANCGRHATAYVESHPRNWVEGGP